MGFVERELARIQSALGNPGDANFDCLFAAQQALSWSLEPTSFKSPFCSITGSPEASASCSAESHPPQLSHNGGPCAGAS